eukprot:1224314-Rhodomonas_salina.1
MRPFDFLHTPEIALLTTPTPVPCIAPYTVLHTYLHLGLSSRKPCFPSKYRVSGYMYPGTRVPGHVPPGTRCLPCVDGVTARLSTQVPGYPIPGYPGNFRTRGHKFLNTRLLTTIATQICCPGNGRKPQALGPHTVYPGAGVVPGYRVSERKQYDATTQSMYPRYPRVLHTRVPGYPAVPGYRYPSTRGIQTGYRVPG